MTTVGVEAISSREAEVLDALGEHLTNAEIARRLHISVRTVESHVSSLLRKLGAGDRRDLAAQAVEMILVPSPSNRGIVCLPASWTSFVGRSAELDELRAALAADRLVSLVGPGGVGKTRLAVMAARRDGPAFPGGGAFVDLLSATSGFVVQAVAAALDVVECAQCALEEVVFDRLRTGRALLILDNCEHVLAPVASFVQALLSTCPQVVILATSRERLGVAGERVVPLAPMSLSASAGAAGAGGVAGVDDGTDTRSEAEMLFRDRAARVPRVASDDAAVAEICRRLDGMPLAIELAAARSRTLGLDGVLAGLDDHLRLLSQARAPGDRHGSLRTVMEWSYQLLDRDERAAFRRLAVFSGSFDLASAASVAGGNDLAGTSDLIGRLADKSLLVHGQSDDGSRWRMLDTVHAYAREQLRASEERREIHCRHLEWAASAAGGLEAALGTDDPDRAWQPRFDVVVDDLRAALAYGAGRCGAAPLSDRAAPPAELAASPSDPSGPPAELAATTYGLAMS
ncbi:MAG: ATP-binding protein, partial [Acidimicrobiales bacterium]